MIADRKQAGFGLVELLISLVIAAIVAAGVFLAYSGSLRVFKDTKSISDTIETKTPSIELLSRYFDRWGVGVATVTGGSCSSYRPAHQSCITLTEGTPCDEITFWGNLYGTGVTQSISGVTANMVSCRLSTSSEQNCYYHWRDDVLQNELDGSNNVIPLSLSRLDPNNADCSGLAAGTTNNATVDTSLAPYTGSTFHTLQAGEVIQRAPHGIRFYCALNANDANQRWLYVDLTDTAADCTNNEPSMPIAPVDGFQAELLPAGCSAATGACTAVKVTVNFRSQSKKYTGEYDTYTVERVFGR